MMDCVWKPSDQMIHRGVSWCFDKIYVWFKTSYSGKRKDVAIVIYTRNVKIEFSIYISKLFHRLHDSILSEKKPDLFPLFPHKAMFKLLNVKAMFDLLRRRPNQGNQKLYCDAAKILYNL